MRCLLTGAQGTGKTTLMSLLPDALRKIQGVTRKCITENSLANNKDSNDHSQKLIFDAYEDVLTRNCNYISERSLIDVCAFTEYQKRLGKCSPWLAENHIRRVHKFVCQNPDAMYFYLPVEFDIEDDGVRSTDKEYQKEIDSIIFEILNEMGCNYYTVTGLPHERADFVMSKIMARCNIAGRGIFK